MYPVSVQTLLSHVPPGRKMVMMASRELTASRAQPPEHSTALVCKTHTWTHTAYWLNLVQVLNIK